VVNNVCVLASKITLLLDFGYHLLAHSGDCLEVDMQWTVMDGHGALKEQVL
jgi:hypothetical protein